MNIDEANAVAINTEKLEDFVVQLDGFRMVEENYDECAEKLQDFVTKNIEVMRQALKMKEIPDRPELMKKFMNHSPVLFSLETLYSRVRHDCLKAQKMLKMFEDEGYAATKIQLEKEAKDGKFKISSSEIEKVAHVKYKQKCAELEARADLADCRRNFVDRMIKDWTAFGFDLSGMNKLLISETYATRLDMAGQSYVDLDANDDGPKNYGFGPND